MYNGYEEIKQATNNLDKMDKKYMQLFKELYPTFHEGQPITPTKRLQYKKALEELKQAEDNKKQAQENLDKLAKQYLPNHLKPYIKDWR